MRELAYSIKPVAPDTIEIHAHSVTYTLVARDKSYFELTASKAGVRMERAVKRVRKNTVEISIEDRDGMRLAFAMTFGTRVVRTDAILGRRRFRIRSAPNEHAAALARTFRGTVGPDARYLRWFNKDMRQQRTFRKAVRGRLPGLDVINGGPATMACIAACACCGFAPVDGPIAAPCCVVCFTCMLE